MIWNPMCYTQRRAQGELEKIVEMWKYSFCCFYDIIGSVGSPPKCWQSKPRTKHNRPLVILTLDIQKHALLVASNPAEGFAVKSTQIAEPYATDRQDRFAMATAHFKTSTVTLWTRTHIIINCWHNHKKFNVQIFQHKSVPGDSL